VSTSERGGAAARAEPGGPAVVGSWDGCSGERLEREWGVPLVETYRTLGSTNDRAVALGREGAPRPSVVVSEAQSAGRGRHGASWQSASGVGIWMSILFEAALRAPQLPLLVGVACARAVESIGPGGGRVRVKWPNDLVLDDDRKVGGILCESGPHGVVVGVGINVASPPGGFAPDVADHATSLEIAWSISIQRRSLAGSIIREIRTILRLPDPFVSVRAELERRDALRGRTVHSQSRGTGVARGIDEHGALLVEAPDGSLRSVTSGSVRLATASTPD
jgi:BirA family biotin operon repressor/biotin-[acetyl-CoA-carboxylase] ligase